ncbi:MMPL family transporter, partial [Mycobacterium simiae]
MKDFQTAVEDQVESTTANEAGKHSSAARWVRRLAVPITVFWLALAAALTIFVPSLERVGKDHSVALSPKDAESLVAIKRIGKVFQEFNSDSAVMVVLEGDRPLGDEAHLYYNELIRKLSADTRHVQHIQDFWGDPLTAAGSQSP